MLIENGEVNPALIRLVRINIPVVMVGDWPPVVLNELLQKEWVKATDGVFRSQLGGRFPNEEEMMLLRQLGAGAIPINFGIKYNGTLLLGATLKAVTRRMKFMLDEELDRQRRFRQQSVPQPVYFLSSGRRLDPKQEMPEYVPAILEETGAQFNDQYAQDVRLGNWPETEIQMMDRVSCWMNTRHWHHHLICAPDVPLPGRAPRSANTAETVKEWLKSASSGHYLVVSSQPSCENQRMAVERAVREAGAEGYTFDVCGPAAPPLPLSKWLDTLAKQLWEECQLLPQLK